MNCCLKSRQFKCRRIISVCWDEAREMVLIRCCGDTPRFCFKSANRRRICFHLRRRFSQGCHPAPCDLGWGRVRSSASVAAERGGVYALKRAVVQNKSPPTPHNQLHTDSSTNTTSAFYTHTDSFWASSSWVTFHIYRLLFSFIIFFSPPRSAGDPNRYSAHSGRLSF